MKKEYLGDSYDIVKRFWWEVMQNIAPLYVLSAFVPEETQDAFTKLTGIEMLPEVRPHPYSLFLDPDTGVLLPNTKGKSEKTHIALDKIDDELKNGAICVIAYDQSFSHAIKEDIDNRLLDKMRYLEDKKRYCFYYKSHAKFLFAFSELSVREKVRKKILNLGMPESRLFSKE